MINSWKNNLLSLPDSIFFDIMRNYLGDLKTPFNKHDLIRSLTTLVLKKEIKQRIFDLIDSEDSRLLTAIALLGAAGIDELYEFTKQYYSFLELHNRIANLQERLLIWIEYPDQNSRSGKKLIRLNPAFEDELAQGYLDNSRIFSTLSVDTPLTQPWLNEQLIAAFISFAMNNRSGFSATGGSRKKLLDSFSGIFHCQPDNDESPLIDFLLSLCRKLGFIKGAELKFSIDFEQVRKFGEHPGEDRKIILAAAAVSTFSRLRENNINTAMKLMFPLFKSLENGSRLHEHDLKAFLFLLRRNAGKTAPDTVEFTDSLIIDALSYCGFLVKDDDFRMLNHGKTPKNTEKLRIQSNFEISAPAGFALSEEIHAACCCEIKNYDITRTYELTKTAFASALDSGLSPEIITERLIESSEGSIPQNISFSMKNWSREYQSISLNYGVVLTVSKDRLPLIEHSPTVKEFFTAVPAPGVFILDPARETEWRKAFKDIGFDMLPSGKDSTPEDPDGYSPPPADLKSYSDTIEYWKGGFNENAGAIIDELSKKISRLSMTEESRQKLEARAQKKLILTDKQLKASNRPEERGEAGGLDHRAKIRLVERALELENLLEVTTARDLDLEKRLVKPVKLVKADSESPDKPPVFRIEGIELPEEKEISIPITRISYLRMLKSSLFTP